MYFNSHTLKMHESTIKVQFETESDDMLVLLHC
jgi:hypothetical protein